MKTFSLGVALLMAQSSFAQDKDVVLQAMRDELERSKAIRVTGSEPPYFMEYAVEDADVLGITASLGALIGLTHSTVRIPTVRVRVGSPAFDNTNHVYSDFYSGSRYDSGQLPVDTDYAAIRNIFWLATDRSYKTAVEAIGRKKSALKNVTQTDQYPDFSAAPPVQAIQPIKRVLVDEAAWKDRVVKLSAVLTGYPKVIGSGLEFQSVHSADYLVNTEGTAIRTPEDLTYVRVRAFAQAPDGMILRNAEVFQAMELEGMPSELDMKRGVTAVGEELTQLVAAPMGEAYDGPVLFEPRAAAQLFAQVMGDNLKIGRKPINEGRRAAPYLPSELESKVGSRILPDWMDIVDDPGQKEWHGQALIGHYEFDVEGVRPQALNLVQKGVLKSFLLTRTPVLKGFEASNGHARMQGRYGASSPGFGNLFVRASQTSSAADLKKRLIEMVQQRNKPYGMLVRKLDYPSGMSLDELRRATTAMAQSGARPVAMPLLVYRVYPDGREELVRGVRFRGLSTRSFKDISAASDESYVLNFLDSTAPFALMGAGSFVTNASVIAPGILFEELEFERIQDDLPKLPIVPPPPLGN
jgi:predicted Zn-dependent protease